MPVLPSTKLGRIEWCEARIAAWTAAPTTIGLTLAEVTALGAQIKDARQAYDAAIKAKNTAKDSTVTSDNEASTMTTLAANAIKHIKAYAASSANPDAVYAAASVPPPAAPGPTPPPGQPTNFTFDLDTNTGGLVVHWKCTNPAGVSGVVYTVRRAIGAAPATTVGVTGEKKFSDTTIPAGSSSITYQVFGQRGSQIGPASNPVTVRFGSGGAMQVFEETADTSANVKLAA
ncbi:MAG: hypothetical protein QM783_13160 [Phycisphaerales bacterium]